MTVGRRWPRWLRIAALVLAGLLVAILGVLIAVGWYVKRQIGDSGGALPPAMAAYDVRRYELAVRVDPAARRIEGRSTVAVAAVATLREFAIHLDGRLAVGGAILVLLLVDFGAAVQVAWICAAHRAEERVLHIAGLDHGQLDRRERKQVEEPLRDDDRGMRADEADPHERGRELERRGALLVAAGRRRECAEWLEARGLLQPRILERHFPTMRAAVKAYRAKQGVLE